MLQQTKVYTMMPVPSENETATSTDLAEAIRIAATRSKETGTLWGIYINLDHLASFNGLHYVRDIDAARYNQEAKEEKKTVKDLYAEIERLNRMVCIDPMTGLFNYRHLRQAAITEFKRASRYNEPLSCVMLDVDDFKHINDTYGHPAGDAVLKRLGFLLRRSLRETDIVARYGGDEFCILLPNTFFDKALMIMQKISRKTLEHPFRINGANGTNGGNGANGGNGGNGGNAAYSTHILNSASSKSIGITMSMAQISLCYAARAAFSKFAVFRV